MEASAESSEGGEGGEGVPAEEEPKLKYERLGNDVAGIVAADAISCVCVHPKLVVVGTAWGRVHVLDHAGHAAGPGEGRAAHAVAVNALSVDRAGEWVGSCADDGRVRVAPLAADGPEAPLELALPRPVRALALHPEYTSQRCFLTGDDATLTLHERTFLGRVRGVVLWSGGVGALAWGGRFAAAAAAGGGGVRVLDMRARHSLGLIQWEASADDAGAAAATRCSLLWPEAHTLMAGWGDTVRVCRVRRRSAVEMLARDHGAPDHLVDPLYTVRTDYTVCGLGPLGDQLAVLGVPREGAAAGARPVLAVSEYKGCEFAEVATDTLNIRGHERYAPRDYRLEALPGESRFFVVSPKELVVASPYDADDRVGWLVERGRWERALEALEAAGGRTRSHSLAAVGARYADHLRAARRWDAAAALCARVCRGEHEQARALWEPQVAAFAAHSQLRALAAHLPRSPERALPPHVYELVLYEHLKLDAAGFLRLVREWSPALYRTAVVVKELLEHLLATRDDRHLYLEALALLYRHQGKHDKALNAYLKLGHPEAFALITRHGMHDVIHDKILELMTLDADRAVAVLLERRASVPVEVVMAQLEGHESLLFKYLDAYARVEPAGAYHGRLVGLYARYARERLLPFLRGSDCYPIQAALDTCQAAGLHAEVVFLLGRMGNTREALHIILERLRDVPRAIAFCQEHDDRELWLDLVRRTVGGPDPRPEHVALLLARLGGYVDGRVLLAHVRAGLRVPGLRAALAAMLAECALQLQARAACRAATSRDYFALHARLVALARRGVRVADEARCGACQGRLLARDPAAAAPLLVRACKHHFHAHCLPPHAHDAPCALCSATATATATADARHT